jgi:DNA polymerase/3'-5' exonuclease PolX
VKQKIPLQQAQRLAHAIEQDLAPYCDFTQVVGSIRREERLVGDIDVMVIPNVIHSADLFGASQASSALETAMPALVEKWHAHKIAAGLKKKTYLLPSGVKLEIYVSDPDAWGVEVAIRTGPERFSRNCVTTVLYNGYLPKDCKIKDGWKVYRGETRVLIHTEKEFLDFLGLGWVEPSDRM